jgi:hypothetical protein
MGPPAGVEVPDEVATAALVQLPDSKRDAWIVV